MSKRKILFFIIVGVVFLGIVGFILTLSSKKDPKINVPDELKIWITEGTTDDFQKIVDGFRSANPQYKNMKIIIEKKTDDPERYRTLLLSTLTDGTGPDIFMVRHGEDSILESKIEPIPGDVIDIGDFQSRFDMTIFDGLITSTGSSSSRQEYLMGVPLGYETLGVFYNTSLMRTGVPSDWNQIEKLYGDFPTATYVTNLGLGPKYVPNMVDDLTLFFVAENIHDYTNLRNGGSALTKYANFANLAVSGGEIDDSYAYASSDTIRTSVSTMNANGTNTFDNFLDGKIGMILGYPSTIIDLEKSAKRVNANTSNLILTARLPQFSSRNTISLARYSYLGISKLSTKQDAALVFINYLKSPDAERAALEIYPYLIAAQSEFIPSQKGKILSNVLNKAKIDAFLPNPGDSVTIFDYGIKSKFDSILKNEFDSTPSTSLPSLADTIARGVNCELNMYNNSSNSTDC